MKTRTNQRDLARAAGVSISTVSRALANLPGISEEVRKQIQTIARELGYQARGIGSSVPEQATALVTLDRATGGLAAFYEALIACMQKAAREASIPLVIRLVTERSLEDALTDRLASDGRRKPLFLIGLDPSSDMIERITKAQAPVVLVNGVDPSMQLDSIAPSNFYGGRLAADILLGLGHRSILYVTSLPRWTTSQRCLGFQLRIEETVGAGLNIVQLAEPTREDAERTVEAMLAKDWRWSAVFCMNDLYAIGVLEALQRHGMKVPGDVSLIGFDDLPFAAMVTPRLSTFQVDSQALGSAAIQLMLRRLADPSARPLQMEVGVRAVEGGTLGRFEGDNRSGPTRTGAKQRGPR